MTLFFRHDGSVVTPFPYSWSGKGDKLTALEHDETIGTLWSNILQLQEQVLEGVTIIDDIAVDDPNNPSLFTITLADYRTFDIPLPVASFNPIAGWTNALPMARLDLFSVSDFGTFYVLRDHTTPSTGTFDPEAVDEDDNLLYQLVFQSSGSIRWTGTFAPGDYNKYDAIHHDEWGVWITNITHEAGDEFDPYLLDGDDRVYTQIAGPPFSPLKTIAATTYEVGLEDVGRYLRFTHDDGCVITFPAYIEWPISSEIQIRAAGGPLTFNEDSGFTINPPRVGYDSTSQYTGATFTAKFVDIDECDLIGPHGEALTS